MLATLKHKESKDSATSQGSTMTYFKVAYSKATQTTPSETFSIPQNQYKDQIKQLDDDWTTEQGTMFEKFNAHLLKYLSSMDEDERSQFVVEFCEFAEEEFNLNDLQEHLNSLARDHELLGIFAREVNHQLDSMQDDIYKTLGDLNEASSDS